MPPLIAVAGALRRGPDVETLSVPARYLRALDRAGVHAAALLPRPLDRDQASRLLRRFDGLLLMGGGDVDPSRYGQEPHPGVYGVDPDRDAFEASLFEAAIDHGLPTLAICRGIQVLNVALGGTLLQHVPDVRPDIPHGVPDEPGWAWHGIRAEPGSLVAKAMGTEEARCASGHHQAVDRLGAGLVPVGWAEDGLVEAVEHQQGWVVGVQWHPEENADRDPAQQGLFDALAEQAGAR